MKELTPANTTFFAPLLALRNVQEGIDFYQRAFGATELRRWSNPDGSVHVAEMSINGAMFHLHEETTRTREFSPETLGGVSAVIGLFNADPDALATRAIAAGALEESPMQDYEYGYRQGTLRDPFGHLWVMQKKIG
jgi:PhnB protein